MSRRSAGERCVRAGSGAVLDPDGEATGVGEHGGGAGAGAGGTDRLAARGGPAGAAGVGCDRAEGNGAGPGRAVRERDGVGEGCGAVVGGRTGERGAGDAVDARARVVRKHRGLALTGFGGERGDRSGVGGGGCWGEVLEGELSTANGRLTAALTNEQRATRLAEENALVSEWESFQAERAREQAVAARGLANERYDLAVGRSTNWCSRCRRNWNRSRALRRYGSGCWGWRGRGLKVLAEKGEGVKGTVRDRTEAAGFVEVGGDSANAGRKAEEAAKAFRAAHETFARLAQESPGDAQAQRDVSISYNNLGNVTLQLGQAEQALGITGSTWRSPSGWRRSRRGTRGHSGTCRFRTTTWGT